MDLKTILILTAISNILIFIFLFLFTKLSIVRNKIFDIYTYGKFIQATGWVLLILRGVVPDIISIAVANSLIILGFGAETFSVASYNKKRLKYRLKIFFIIAMILVVVFLILTNFEDNIRIAYMSLVFFIWLIIASQQLIVYRKKNKLQFATGIIFAFFALFTLVRALSAFLFYKTDTLFDTNIIQIIVYSALLLFNFVSALLLLLLLKEQDEETIKLSEEKFKNFTEFLPQIVFEINTKGEVLYLNKQAYLLTGYSPKDIKNGLNISDVFVKEDLERVLKKSKAIMLGEGQTGTEYFAKKKNGEKFPVLIYSSPIIEVNKVLGLRGIIVDITDRKKAEQELIESELKLKESNKTKDKFFSIIAHDLKSPFTSLLGFSELLVNNYDEYDVQQHKEFIGIIHQGVQNTHKLLENLLIWSQTQSGIIDYKPKKNNLYLLSSETITLLSQLLVDKSIILRNKIPQDICVNADKNMLLTILRNLLSNAIKFTNCEGEIIITAKQYDNYAEISVKDNGVGIPPEIQSGLFKIAENVSTAGTDNEQGTGLGLILCKEFVEKHGGKIWVESKFGNLSAGLPADRQSKAGGSEFKFTIPLV